MCFLELVFRERFQTLRPIRHLDPIDLEQQKVAELRQCQAEPSEPTTVGVPSCEDGECTDTHLADIDTPAQQVLAKQFCGSTEAITRVDMSEMMERHSVSKLLGSPPGAPALPALPVGSCGESPSHSCLPLTFVDIVGA